LILYNLQEHLLPENWNKSEKAQEKGSGSEKRLGLRKRLIMIVFSGGTGTPNFLTDLRKSSHQRN